MTYRRDLTEVRPKRGRSQRANQITRWPIFCFILLLGGSHVWFDRKWSGFHAICDNNKLRVINQNGRVVNLGCVGFHSFLKNWQN